MKEQEKENAYFWDLSSKYGELVRLKPVLTGILRNLRAWGILEEYERGIVLKRLINALSTCWTVWEV